MDYSQLVTVLNSANYLLKDFARFLFLHAFLTDDIIEQLSSFHVLHNQKQMFRCFYDFIEVNDVGMAY